MKELNRLLARQDFKDENELKAFLNSLIGKPLSQSTFDDLTPQEQAEDLIEEARQLPPTAAIAKINKALEIYPDCIEAYELLAVMQKNANKVLEYLNQGVAIGERLFEGENAEKYAGHFWGMHDTRPYMRCLAGKATLLYRTGQKEEGIAIQEKMLVLNPGDNQGVRDELSLRYVELGFYDKFTALYKQYDDGEHSLMAFFAYNRVLCEFKAGGDTEAARESLAVALKVNKFVPKKLIALAPVRPPDYYGIGDESEASYYCVYAKSVWHNTKGAIEWLKKQTKK
jgi:tetratricopeptide (TPR) repeat protein